MRLRKLRPEGTAYLNWYCYRLPDKAGFVRLFVPARTPRLHVTGSWTPDGVAIVAIDPARSYVVHWWRAESRAGFYVDAARSIQIRSGIVSYVDLYLDLACEGDDWRLLDEDELSVLSEDDARLARSAIGDVRQAIASGSPLFDANDDMWTIPDDALRLEPRRVRRVVQTIGYGFRAGHDDRERSTASPTEGDAEAPPPPQPRDSIDVVGIDTAYVQVWNSSSVQALAWLRATR